MDYHALGSLEIWDRMVHVIIFYESTDIRMYMYVVVLNQNTPMVRKTLFWVGGGREQQVFSSLQGGNRTFLKQVRGNRCFFKISFQFQEPHWWY